LVQPKKIQIQTEPNALPPTRMYTSGRWQVDIRRRELRADGCQVPIGMRAFEIIEVLLRSAGKLVTKDELMRAVWPGAVVEEATVWVHISAIRKALGPDRPMLKTVSRRGYCLLGNWIPTHQDLLPEDAVYESLDVPAQRQVSNIPEAAHDLIGRAIEMRKLMDLSSAYRAITLTGPGGIGKTVLALEVARRLLPGFGGNCWFVDLSSIADPNLVASAVATTLGLRLGGDARSPEAVARAIGRTRLLLVIDNCEHVVDAASSLAETIINFCPLVSILTTSREILRFRGEHVFRVPSLETPPGANEDATIIPHYSAAQLFIARTRALHSDFSPDDISLFLIASICNHLDGIPLAIEFASACAATIGLPEIVARLDDRFGLLTAGQRTAPPRQRTLVATLEWSYQLLPERERRLLRHLAVFRGGFTIDAAIAVAGGDIGSADMVAGIGNLVRKSLVATEGSVVNRWRLLETTRVYARRELDAHGETQEALKRHALYFQGLATQPMGFESTVLQQSREIDNVRAALEWAFSPDGDAAIGVSLTAVYASVWLHLSLLPEARSRTERALASVDQQTSQQIRMKLQIALGLALIFTMGPVTSIRPAITFALKVARELGDTDTELRALWALWILDTGVGETDAGKATAEKFRELAVRIGEQAILAFSNRLLGYTLHLGGNQRDAQHRFKEVIDAFAVPVGQQYTTLNFDHRAVSRAGLAATLLLQGFVDQAVEESQASLDEALATGFLVSTCEVLRLASFPIALMTGNFVAAENAIALLVDVAARQNGTYWIVLGQFLRGELDVKRGAFASGVALLQRAVEKCSRNGWASRYPEFLAVLAEGLAGLGQLNAARLTIDRALAWAERGGEFLYAPEVFRTKGELMIRNGEPVAAAEGCFLKALDLAREQRALFWELRATLSLAKLKVSLGRRIEAQMDLSQVYCSFSEGFSSVDLRTARAMLSELSAEEQT
jgi:predicted ATPase/DNA-binding winged helix-turn-helix (wHTH) protein